MQDTKPYQLMLVLQDDAHLEAWVTFAHKLLQGEGEIHLRGLVTIPEGVSLSEGTMEARRLA